MVKLIKSQQISVLFILILIISCSAFSQQGIEVRFSKLETNNKKSINRSISTLSKVLRRANWATVYNLLMKDSNEEKTKEEFIQEMKEKSKNPFLELKIVGFVARNFLVLNDKKMQEKVNITGCVEVKIRRKIYYYLGMVDIGRNGSEQWLFFSLPFINPDSSTGGPKPC